MAIASDNRESMVLHPLLEKYANAVMSAPESLNLTAAREPAEFLERHVLDALKLLELLPKPTHREKIRVIDVGSGNGIPGLPIAIALPHWDIFLLESNSKKAGFIDMFCKFNAINNAHVLAGRAEEFGHAKEHREEFDLAFSRALGKLPVALELCLPFLKLQGLLVIPHGRSFETELARSKKAMKELGAVHQNSTPYSLRKGMTFTALTFRKVSATPEKYPRKPGIPTKKPLT
jgi:16S rRNA (guanine527-N7)-methyltransferase